MALSSIGIGIVGFGYWGQNLVRNFLRTPGCRVAGVCDSDPSAMEDLGVQYPELPLFRDADSLINDPSVQAVVIATPVSTHYPFARLALLAGRHVLIEKPMASSVQEATELLELAREKGLVIAVDHTFLYTGAVRSIRQQIASGQIGELRYFDSTRINLGLFQPDVNVLWDLACHDISILTFLVEEDPVSVNATGISHTGNGLENIAYLTLHYSRDLIAHVHCSWSSPVKIRQTLIGGDKRMIIYNDIEPTEKIRVYDTGYTIQNERDQRKLLVDYRTGDITIPKFSTREALSLLAEDFIESISQGRNPLSDAMMGLRVVRILEAAQRSLKQQGAPVKLEEVE